MRTFIILLIVAFAFTSCEKYKEDDTWINGQVINDITGEPLEGWKINVIERKKTGFAESSYDVIKSVYSDKNGEFKITVNTKWANKYNYDLAVWADNRKYVAGYTENHFEDNIRKQEVNYFKIKGAPSATIKVIPDPLPPFAPGDSMFARFTTYTLSGFKYSFGTGMGLLSEGGRTYKDIYMGTYYVDIFKRKNGIETIKKDTFFVGWDETKNYVLDFK